MGFFVDLFAFRLRSRRIWDPGRAKDSARHAGHYGANSSRIGRLLSRSATDSRSSRPGLRNTETIRNEKRSENYPESFDWEPKTVRKGRARAGRSFSSKRKGVEVAASDTRFNNPKTTKSVYFNVFNSGRTLNTSR